MIFLSMSYSSMKYTSQVFKILNNDYDRENVIEYAMANKNGNKKIDKEALEKLLENYDMDFKLWIGIDSVIYNLRVSYLKDEKPKIMLYDKREIKQGEFNKIYVGNNLREDFKDKVNILEKTYDIGETVGIKGMKTIFDSSITLYVNEVESLCEFIKSADTGTPVNISLYKKNKNYNDYEEDMQKVFNEEEYYTQEITRKPNMAKDLEFGEEYIALILIGLISTVSISTFWIADRKKELAIKRAFGAKKKHILQDIYKELLNLSLYCGIISFIVSYITKKFSNDISFAMISINLKDFLYLFIMIVVISSMVSIVPIYKAINTDIASSLKDR